ncbi:glycosyltransferase [Hydrogenophaga sp. 2FB]|uniref:glycosyltransferase n=1 Tax=Hydrogenophaga sp. 2FB TaxID=2502187 RepID=UPI001485659F|nr:glycosyltransferase [Hydrogenophaga sp. 2FB]
MNLPAPLVSIVIPAYNHGNYLAEAIRSVLAQDHSPLELIVLDDGSTDHTPDVLARVDGDFLRERHANIGQARTLEKGWSMAKGSILGYLSADDTLAPGAVSAAVAALQADPDAVATYCDYHLLDPQSRPVRQVQAPPYDYRAMFVDVVCPPGPGAFFRRDAYDATGPWNPALRQMPDYDFWLRLGLHGHFIRIERPLAGFRVHDDSQSFAPTTPQRAAEPVAIIEGLLRTPGLAPDIMTQGSQALAHAHLISAQLHLRAGRWGAAGRSVRAAWSQSWSRVLSMRALRLLGNALFNRAGHRLLWTLRSGLSARNP